MSASREANEHLQQRIDEARERVQAALARLPAPPDVDAEAATGARRQHATEAADDAPEDNG